MAEDEWIGFEPGMFEGEGTEGLRIPARFVRQAHIAHTAVGGLKVAAAGPDIAFDGNAYTAMICDGGAFHYYHLVESLVWLRAIQHRFLSGRPPAEIILSLAWDDPRQCGLGRPMMAALYPRAKIRDPNDAWPRSLDQTLILHRSWAQMQVNKYLEAAMPFGKQAARDMANAARGAVSANGAQGAGSNILYVTRPPPRCLVPQLERALLRCLAEIGACTVIDFAAIPWAQQVRYAAAHDVMMSVHGNGLTNAIWMRPGSLLVELFPAGARPYDYQFLAELFGLRYLGFEGERVFKEGDRTPQYGDAALTNAPITSLAIERIIAQLHQSLSVPRPLMHPS